MYVYIFYDMIYVTFTYMDVYIERGWRDGGVEGGRKVWLFVSAVLFLVIGGFLIWV